MSSIPTPQKTPLHTTSGHPPTTPSLFCLLTQAMAWITRLGIECSADRQRLQELYDRLAAERLHLAVLGQFKRGKSTLLNALLGETLLPTSVVPLTAIPTFLFPGSTLQAHIVYHNGSAPDILTSRHPAELTTVLARFVTEEGNPHNQRNVAYVEVYHPAPLLRRGVVLIDTPGIGSTLCHNTEATLNFLPQCDAALFLVSADPPLTEVADYLNVAERQAALSFLKKVLREQVGWENPEPIFCISARQGLEARQTNNQQRWERSGLAELENHLRHFLVSDKTKVLQTAVARKAVDRLAEVLMRLQLTIRSLQLPLADLDERQRLFAQKLAEAEQQQVTAQDLLTGDHKRLVVLLGDQAEQLRQRANALVETVRRTAADLFEVAYQPLDSSDAFAFERQPYWVTHQWRIGLSPFSPQLMDRLLPVRVRQARRLARLQEQIEKLVISNVENLRWATRQNVDQAIRRFRTRLDEWLRETGIATQNAILAARRQRQERAETVTDPVARLEATANNLEQLQTGMAASYELS